MAKWRQLATTDMLNNSGSQQYQSFSVSCARKKIPTEDNWHWLCVNANVPLSAGTIDTTEVNSNSVTSITSADAANGVFCHNLYPLGGTMVIKRMQCSIAMESWGGSGTDIMYVIPCLFSVDGGAASYTITHKCTTMLNIFNSTSDNIAFKSISNAQAITGLDHEMGVYLGFLMRANEADLAGEWFNFTFHMTYDAIEG